MYHHGGREEGMPRGGGGDDRVGEADTAPARVGIGDVADTAAAIAIGRIRRPSSEEGRPEFINGTRHIIYSYEITY